MCCSGALPVIRYYRCLVGCDLLVVVLLIDCAGWVVVFWCGCGCLLFALCLLG